MDGRLVEGKKNKERERTKEGLDYVGASEHTPCLAGSAICKMGRRRQKGTASTRKAQQPEAGKQAKDQRDEWEDQASVTRKGRQKEANGGLTVRSTRSSHGFTHRM